MVFLDDGGFSSCSDLNPQSSSSWWTTTTTTSTSPFPTLPVGANNGSDSGGGSSINNSSGGGGGGGGRGPKGRIIFTVFGGVIGVAGIVVAILAWLFGDEEMKSIGST
jgi:hypothetical protein